MNLLAFVIAAAIGAVARYWLELNTNPRELTRLPWGTLAANLIGSAILGWSASHVGDEVHQVFFASFCGAFTTFGGFIAQTWHRLRQSELRTHAVVYLTLSVVGSLACAWLGHAIG